MMTQTSKNPVKALCQNVQRTEPEYPHLRFSDNRYSYKTSVKTTTNLSCLPLDSLCLLTQTTYQPLAKGTWARLLHKTCVPCLSQ
jgi:hypothetical protein